MFSSTILVFLVCVFLDLGYLVNHRPKTIDTLASEKIEFPTTNIPTLYIASCVIRSPMVPKGT